MQKSGDYDKNLNGVKGMVSSEKLLSCAFLPDVLCSYRKDEKFGIMTRCFKCPHYIRFMREMDEEDERMMNEIDEERARLDKERASQKLK